MNMAINKNAPLRRRRPEMLSKVGLTLRVYCCHYLAKCKRVKRRIYPLIVLKYCTSRIGYTGVITTLE